MAHTPAAQPPFWRKPLDKLTEAEWESLCDQCGRCCLVKLEDEDTGRVHFTNLGCRLLQSQNCRCGDYENRQSRVPDCVKLTPATVSEIPWLPPTCAYRLVAEGKDLMWWHPLVSGSTETVHEAGVSVRNRVAASEDDVRLANYPKFIVAWPGRKPRAGRKTPAK
ncbi:MAG TPA: YcgN family cysteine cluster protein [Beijerinckiaceae bacterium]|nr:YcgN family cysteine cluster protein [Beijerinckiaceae bacterium]